MATISLSGNDYSAFADVAFADEYLAADVKRATVWAAYGADDKARGMISATRLLERVNWADGVPSFDTPPDAVKDATALLAADILAKPALGDSSSTASNIKRVKAGSVETEFFNATRSDEATPLPENVMKMLRLAKLLGGGTVSAPYVAGAEQESRFTYDEQTQ